MTGRDRLPQLRAGHERPEAVRETGGRSSYATEGVTGLKSLGVRELNYRLNFLACAVHLADANGALPPLTPFPSSRVCVVLAPRPSLRHHRPCWSVVLGNHQALPPPTSTSRACGALHFRGEPG
jgi:hypothetical protein